jgi:hypothetical protein
MPVFEGKVFTVSQMGMVVHIIPATQETGIRRIHV